MIDPGPNSAVDRSVILAFLRAAKAGRVVGLFIVSKPRGPQGIRVFDAVAQARNELVSRSSAGAKRTGRDETAVDGVCAHVAQ